MWKESVTSNWNALEITSYCASNASRHKQRRKIKQPIKKQGNNSVSAWPHLHLLGLWVLYLDCTIIRFYTHAFTFVGRLKSESSTKIKKSKKNPNKPSIALKMQKLYNWDFKNAVINFITDATFSSSEPYLLYHCTIQGVLVVKYGMERWIRYMYTCTVCMT